MLEPGLMARPAVSLATGRHGRPDGPPGLLVQERTGRQIVGIAARRGRGAEVAAAVERRWGLTLPLVPRVVGGAELAFAWAGAWQWMAHAPGGEMDLEAELRRVLDGLATLTAQGDGRVVLHVRGPAVRTVLATGLPIDLHPRVFTPGDTALTLAGHIAVQVRQLDDAPSYELTAFRGYADDLCGWLLEAGAAHGVAFDRD